MKDTLLRLLNAYGAAGCEGNVTDVLASMVAPHCDEMRTDALGNLICIKKGAGRKVMVCAHMDHIGFVVTDADEKGFLRVGSVGGMCDSK